MTDLQSLVGKRVAKVGGSFQHTGVVIAAGHNVAGEPRVLIEFDEPMRGLSRAYSPEQVEVIEG